MIIMISDDIGDVKHITFMILKDKDICYPPPRIKLIKYIEVVVDSQELWSLKINSRIT